MWYEYSPWIYKPNISQTNGKNDGLGFWAKGHMIRNLSGRDLEMSSTEMLCGIHYGSVAVLG